LLFASFTPFTGSTLYGFAPVALKFSRFYPASAIIGANNRDSASAFVLKIFPAPEPSVLVSPFTFFAADVAFPNRHSFHDSPNVI